jgi:chromosome segregation ATPase
MRVNDEIEVKHRKEDLRLLDDAHPLKPLIVWCLQYEELRPTVATIHNHICNDEKTRLEWEIKQLKMEVEDKLTDISVLKQVSEQYEADFHQERKDREDAAGRFDEKEEEWRKGSEMREKQLDQLKTANGQLALRVADLENEVESLKKEVIESHKMEEDLRKKLSNKEQTLEKKEVTHQKKVDELNHEITKLKADLVEKRKSKRGVKTRSESLEEACTQLQSEKTDMEHQLTTLVESNKMKGERNRELMQENAQLKAELRLAAATGKMEEQSKDQDSRCRAQEQQIQSLSRCRAQEQQIQSLQEQSKGQDSRCRAQEQQIQSLQEQSKGQDSRCRAPNLYKSN